MPRRMRYANKFFHPAICLALFVSVASAKTPLTLPQNAILHPPIVLRNAPYGTSPLSGPIDFENHPMNLRQRLFTTTTSPDLKWVRTSSTWYKFSPTAGVWDFYWRDTSIYNSEGILICLKGSYAQNGWARENIDILDTTIISLGPLRIETMGLQIINGIVDSINCIRLVFLCDDIQNTVTNARYYWYAGKWKMTHLDSLKLNATAPVFKEPINFKRASINSLLYYYPPYLISRRHYEFKYPSDSLKYFDFETKIEAESRDSSFVILHELSRDGNKVDTEIIVRSLLPNDNYFDSTIAKDTLGNWVPTKRSIQGYGVDSNYTIKIDNFNNGDWITELLFTMNKFASYSYYAWNSHQNQWDGIAFDLFDTCSYDTLSGYAKWDSINNHWDTLSLVQYTNVYDDYGNLKIRVTARKEGTEKYTKEDSTIYSYAQINILPVRTQGMPQKSKLIVTQSRSALRFFASGITGIRIYTIAGRLAYSADQPPSPSMTLHSKNLPLLSTAGIYFAKVMTPRCVFTRQFTICY
jgi:hypothetical protein